MDKDFEKKVKRKRLRVAAVLLIVIAAAVYLLLDMDVEKADYTDSLNDEIASARELHDIQKENTGNGKGKYAEYTLLAFKGQIEEAEAVAGSEESEYNDKKEAYEKLKEQSAAFRKAENSDVIEKADAEKLADQKKTEEYTVEIRSGKDLVYTIDGEKISSPRVMNLTARDEEGPYYEKISGILQELSLQGQIISFYQTGSFGAELKAKIPFYSEKEIDAYAYKVDLKNDSLKYVSAARVDTEEQTAEFTVKEGGDYVILTKKLHQDGKKTVDIEKAEKEAAETEAESSEKNSGSGSVSDSNNDGGGSNQNGGSSPAAKPDSDNITVTIEIRCDTLAQDLSKLEDPALKAYVPSDGTILSRTKVTVKPGSTVFDVLNKVCRDKNIQVESSYTPMYGSYYVEGINYLYEFDGGKLSGWMYKVNGWFPNYGCSSYTLKDGDEIVWCYTCGLGKDVGGGSSVS